MADNFISAPPALTVIISEISFAKWMLPVLELKQNLVAKSWRMVVRWKQLWHDEW